jgi:hypothetical protein
LSGLAFEYDLARAQVGSNDLLRVPVRFNYSDADGDVERLRVRVTDPLGRAGGAEFSAQGLGLTGTSGSFRAPLLTFRSTNAPGAYDLALTLIDRNGHASATLNATFILTAFGGAEPLSMGFVDPPGGPAGTMVTLFGSGFDPTAVSSNRVTLGGVPVEVTDASSFALTVRVPETALSGRFRVAVGDRVAFSPAVFVIPETITLSPTNSAISVGAREQFEATVLARGQLSLVWSVNGIPGGNGSVGTISPQGLYRAPVEIPTGGVVTISARLASKPAITGQTQVRIFSTAFHTRSGAGLEVSWRHGAVEGWAFINHRSGRHFARKSGTFGDHVGRHEQTACAAWSGDSGFSPVRAGRIDLRRAGHDCSAAFAGAATRHNAAAAAV